MRLSLRRPLKYRKATISERKLLYLAVRRWHGLHFANGIPRRKLGRRVNVKHLLESGKIDPNQAAIGVKVELEHTKRPELALEIALAHLLERPDYYVLLERMEHAPRVQP